MRKVYFFFLFILLPFFLFFSVQNLFAIEKSSEDFYQELVQNYRRYQNLLETFEIQKARHLTYQSVSTQADFLEATKNLTIAEIESITSYASFVRAYLAEATKIINYQENYLYVTLDDELNFLSSAKNTASNLSSLTDSQSFLLDVKSHWKKISNIGYQTKSTIELGSVNKLLENVKIETDKVNVFIEKSEKSPTRVNAAKEKFLALKQELELAENLYDQANKLSLNFKEGTSEAISKEIRQNLDKVLNKLDLVVTGYQDIVNSLKQDV